MKQLILGTLTGFGLAVIVIGAIFLLATYAPPPPKLQPMFVAGTFLGVIIFMVIAIGVTDRYF
jgi:membrane-bound ClpP family serine protease